MSDDVFRPLGAPVCSLESNNVTRDLISCHLLLNLDFVLEVNFCEIQAFTTSFQEITLFGLA